VLGAAAIGAAGVAGVRLLGLHRLHAPVATAPSRSDWISPLGSESARVAQLLRRTSFGATPAELERSLSDGYARTLDRLLETPAAKPPEIPAAHGPYRQFQIQALQQWWIEHILTSPTPFSERMTLFWHNHFTSDYRKVANNTFMYWQNLTWRRLALTDLRTMLMEVSVDPAMLRYLDLGTSTGQNPNENYSRELMELFAMGPGNYTEDDVRAGAKALAGYVLPKPSGNVEVVVDKKSNVIQKQEIYATQAAGIFDAKRAYQGQLTFLKKSQKWDLESVLAQILAQPATAPFIVNKVLNHFVMPQPPAPYVKRLADRFRATKYDLKALMRDVLTSPEASAAPAYRSLVKSPLEFMVGAAKAVEAPQQGRAILAACQGMGQIPFDPPDVGGWPYNDAWVSSNTWLARVNFVSQILAGKTVPAGAADAYKRHLDGVLGPTTAKLLNQATDDRTRWFLVLASPEFQLK
jgi:uncharacterized protein (DUF1800 family)